MKVFREYVHDGSERMLGFKIDSTLLSPDEAAQLAAFAELVDVAAETFLDYEVSMMGDIDFPALLLYYKPGADVNHIRTMLRLYFES